MRAAVAVVLVVCGGALIVGCEVIDDFSPFHVVAGSSGSAASVDLALASDGAATSDIGDHSTSPVIVNITGHYNQLGVYADGATFAVDGGLSGTGDACSANILTAAPAWFGCMASTKAFAGGNTVQARGQMIATKQARFSTLHVLALAVYGPRAARFSVEYSDGNDIIVVPLKAVIMSDWLTPEPDNTTESVVVALSYYLRYDGRTDSRESHVYGYTFQLDSTRSVAGIVFPNDPNVTVFAASLE